MARRTLNRRALRDQHDAAENRAKTDSEEVEDEEIEDEDEDEEGDEEGEEEGEEEASEEDEDEEVVDEDDEEGAPRRKKKKPKKEPKVPKPRKPRVGKTTRKRMVWAIYDNSYRQLFTFDYSKKTEAEAKLAQLREEKKGTFFINPKKEDIVEEKADAKK